MKIILFMLFAHYLIDAPNEKRILSIMRNLAMVPQNEVEMAAHRGTVEVLVLNLSHPNPACVEDALETLILLADHLIIGPWDDVGQPLGESISAETFKTFLGKIIKLLCDGYPPPPFFFPPPNP